MELGNDLTAPFVMKTYEMVNDPCTDELITWGRGNNSFVVLDPLDFSQSLLPKYFKHNNFSSFIRQLNTYGFRKANADKWEFAHESFLRGQKHLLKNITRRKSHRSPPTCCSALQAQDEKSLLSELSRLQQEQRALDEVVEGMNRRLQATEKKPLQMMAFLAKVARDPEFLSRVGLEKEASSYDLGEKKRRSQISSTLPLRIVVPTPLEKNKDKKGLTGLSLSQTTNMSLCQQNQRLVVDQSKARDGDLYTLVTSATTAAAAASASVGTNVADGWPQNDYGYNQIQRPYFTEYGGVESTSQTCVYRD